MIELHDSIIYAKDINARIQELEDMGLDDWNQELEDELGELIRFRKEITDQFGQKAWDAGLSLIADHYKSAYAASHADEIFGGDATSQQAWSDDVYEEGYYEGWVMFQLEDTEYWTDGER